VAILLGLPDLVADEPESRQGILHLSEVFETYQIRRFLDHLMNF
jgi:hypothetical protein